MSSSPWSHEGRRPGKPGIKEEDPRRAGAVGRQSLFMIISTCSVVGVEAEKDPRLGNFGRNEEADPLRCNLPLSGVSPEILGAPIDVGIKDDADPRRCALLLADTFSTGVVAASTAPVNDPRRPDKLGRNEGDADPRRCILPLVSANVRSELPTWSTCSTPRSTAAVDDPVNELRRPGNLGKNDDADPRRCILPIVATNVNSELAAAFSGTAMRSLAGVGEDDPVNDPRRPTNRGRKDAGDAKALPPLSGSVNSELSALVPGFSLAIVDPVNDPRRTGPAAAVTPVNLGKSEDADPRRCILTFSGDDDLVDVLVAVVSASGVWSERSVRSHCRLLTVLPPRPPMLL